MYPFAINIRALREKRDPTTLILYGVGSLADNKLELSLTVGSLFPSNNSLVGLPSGRERDSPKTGSRETAPESRIASGDSAFKAFRFDLKSGHLSTAAGSSALSGPFIHSIL